MNDPLPRFGFARWLLLSGVIMSLGWGLRGFIGGGPLGAMIPGALVALAICFLSGMTGGAAGRAAAFGAVGIGFGGQETYGQTMQFLSRPEMLSLAFAGLAVKGTVWGVVGGACLGTGLTFRIEHRRALLWALALLIVGTFLGWKFIDEPKLLYFSNRLDRPRAELWAGLLIGGLFFLAWLWRAGLAGLPTRFALAGAIGGGVGFPLGGALMLAGRALPLAKDSYPGWKVMEFTFGLCFGLALGLCAYLNRRKLTAGPGAVCEKPKADRPWLSVGLALLAVAAVWAGLQLPVRFSFTVTGAALLAGVLYSERWAWQVALTVTVAAFTLDVTDFYAEQQPAAAGLGWSLLVVVFFATAWWLAANAALLAGSVRRALLFLLGTALAAAWGRTLLYETLIIAQCVVTAGFTLLAVMIIFLARRASPESPSS